MPEFNKIPFKRDEISQLSHTQVRLSLREQAAIARMRTGDAPASFPERLFEEAADRMRRLEKLEIFLGYLAPAGTAPRTAFEELYRLVASDTDEPTDAYDSPVITDLRNMLEPHWAEWTPTLRAIEGLPAIEPITEP